MLRIREHKKMIDFKKLISEYSHCECGKAHECAIKDIVVEHGATERVGEILKKNGFPKNLLLVADKTTLKAAAGVKNHSKISPLHTIFTIPCAWRK